jgi:hypothetical protein
MDFICILAYFGQGVNSFLGLWVVHYLHRGLCGF